MGCFFNGVTGYGGFGMFSGFGGIFWIVLTVLGTLIAVKLFKGIFSDGKVKREE
jgi:hypothetical protein